MPPGQLVHEPPPASDPKSESTDEEDDREEDGVCYFSEYGPSEDEVQPRSVYEVTPKLDSGHGSTTPTKPRPVPAPNVRACSKSSPGPRRLKIKRLKSPGDTPGREVVVRQNATELMDEDVLRWAVAAAEPRKELLF